METLNTVKTAIFGKAEDQSGQEPISGQRGEQAYDAGNESENIKDSTSAPSSHSTTSSSDPTGSSSGPTVESSDSTVKSLDTTGPTSDPTTGASNPTTGSSNPTTGSSNPTTGSSNPPHGPSDTGTGINRGGDPRIHHETPGTGVTSAHSSDAANESGSKTGAFGTVEPSVGAAPDSGVAPKQKQQGGDRPTEAPSDGDDNNKELQFKKDPNDHSGEPLRMHNIDDERRKSIASQPGGGERGKEKGTGQEYVKSTGLQADGGDFDATKPGAGMEADRLLEEKGIHREAGDPIPKDPNDSGKVSLGTKIKDKLHIGSKHKE
ncbi:hypothetical protein M501DRAFT_1005357 [Patellaria atrata CBS 101060]|uniref:Glycine-rich cell wall structural protein 1 n=1 Tax=Patellaria atrata CBS 101060 TaxID=1346257 RepID=A0A9P4VMC1_9PEZI|nr:hypothetical protein M501DRAFT_1005357 [Patellaria atrata CBS 101060]